MGKTERNRRWIEQQGGRCLRCGESRNLTIDHVVPKALGGANLRSNSQVLCLDCNAWKDNRTLDYRKLGVPKGTLSWIEIKVRDIDAEV